MNMKQLAKLMAAGVLAMTTVPAISFAHTHHHVQAIAPSLSATTTTPMTSTVKHTRTSLVSRKRTGLSVSGKSHKALSHRRTAHTALSHRTTRHSALSHRTSKHTALSHLSHKATKLSSKRAGL
jgi:hypothetical protein